MGDVVRGTLSLLSHAYHSNGSCLTQRVAFLQAVPLTARPSPRSPEIHVKPGVLILPRGWKEGQLATVTNIGYLNVSSDEFPPMLLITLVWGSSIGDLSTASNYL